MKAYKNIDKTNIPRNLQFLSNLT